MSATNNGGLHFRRLRQSLVLVPRPRPRILSFLHRGPGTHAESLLAIPLPFAIAPLTPLPILALTALTIVSFHLAYLLPRGGFLMVGYLLGLFSHLRFTWLNVGYAFSDSPLLSLLMRPGVYGLGFLLMLLIGLTSLLSFRAKIVSGTLFLCTFGIAVNLPIQLTPALSYRRVTDALVRQGAEALIVPTMDIAEWGRYQHQLHGRVAKVRAAEFGLPIFRVCSSGVSQLTDRQGQVIASAPFPGEYATLAGSLELAGPGRLPWDHWGAPLAVGVTIAISAYLAAYEILQFLRRRTLRKTV